MGTDSVTISPAAAGAGSAVLGIGAGYVFAPHKYSLERLLMQDDSSFARNFSDEKMKHATVKDVYKRQFPSMENLILYQVMDRQFIISHLMKN